MSTKVQCPNSQCGLIASVPEDKLGHAGRCKRCGARFTLSPATDGSAPLSPGSPAPVAVAPPAVIGRYQVWEKLGSGAFGTVYRAYDPQLEREVALKVLRPEALSSPQAVERFQREARAAAKMHYPHIVPVYDAGPHGEQFFIVSAFIPGCTLDSAIPEEGLDPRRAA
jgi:serine/threonine protein kinase